MRRVKQGGFTLIELMITVAIIGIIAAVAYPSYVQYVTRAKRTAAQSFMFTVTSKLETGLLNAPAAGYPTVAAAADWSSIFVVVPKEVSSSYTVTVAANNASAPASATVTAAPIAADTRCGTLTLTQAGVKGSNGTLPVSECWK